MTSLSRPRVEFISTILQTVLNLGLLSLGLIPGCIPREGNAASGGRAVRAGTNQQV